MVAAATEGRIILRTTLTSPFGRKVRMAAIVLEIAERLDIIAADTLAEDDTLRRQNPLGKMPCLVLGDGTALYDSRVILEFLGGLATCRSILPPPGLARCQALTFAALCDGIADAALLMVYEGRFREAPQMSERWLGHQRGKVLRGLDAVERAPPDPARTDIASIGLACALSYLDWRKPVEWRSSHAALAAWLADFARNEPAFEATKRP